MHDVHDAGEKFLANLNQHRGHHSKRRMNVGILTGLAGHNPFHEHLVHFRGCYKP